VPTLAALVGALLIAIPVVAVTVERHQVDTLAERLLAEARVVGEALPWQAGAVLDAACARMSDDLGVRITVIAPDGRVLGESTRSSESLENHAARPEIVAALADGAGHAVRRSATVGVDLIYAAWRQQRGRDVRVVRTAMPLTTVAANVAALRRLLLAGLLGAVLLGLAVALVASRRLLRRVQRLVAFARTLASGAPTPYLAPERRDDLGVLEEQLADMAREVAATIAALRVERERLEGILRGMVEGVVVTDLDGNVVLLNGRARELLDVPTGVDGRGHPLIDLARQPQLAEILRALAAGASTLTRDVEFGADEVTVQVNAARLCDPDGRPFGFVLVLHDVSELRRLEVIRRDFVANVSHELRTPLTAIKGYAETLLGPAGTEPDTRRRFLSVIDRHSERLGRLIDDLLTLSDLELGRTPLRLATVAVAPAIDDVVQILSAAAARAGVELTAVVAADTPPVAADPDRFRQVLINLVDNAIKYSPRGGRVEVRAGAADAHENTVRLDVRDTGIGIPAQDLPRLTERFFRVDKGRSRALGGTGLGLAIVKHIVQAHGGELDIQSTVGAGTTVRVWFRRRSGARGRGVLKTLSAEHSRPRRGRARGPARDASRPPRRRRAPARTARGGGTRARSADRARSRADGGGAPRRAARRDRGRRPIRSPRGS
jgi:two-component system phosphate regulon sensor histidine kinase PhoR